jgi:hypothetical protein
MPASKFTEEQAQQMLSLYQEGLSTTKIGEQFGCTRSTVRDTLKRLGAEVRKQGDSQPEPGDQLGEFTVIGKVGFADRISKRKDGSEYRMALWELRCSCGAVVQRDNLLVNQYKRRVKKVEAGEAEGKSRLHCQNHPVHYMPCKVGDVLGYLKVIGFPEVTGDEVSRYGDGTQPRGRAGRWWVACVCLGCDRYSEEEPLLLRYGTWNQRVKNVEAGGNASCGCMSNRTHGLTSASNTDLIGARLNTALKACRGRAKNEGLPFDLDLEYLRELGIPEVCPVLGIPIHLDQEGRSDHSPSLDKFYPARGYVKGNVQFISDRANRIKNDGSPEEWLKIAEWCQQEDVKRKLQGL